MTLTRTRTPERPRPAPTDELQRLAQQVAELEREREHLVAMVDILQEATASLQCAEILQTVARKLGQTFGLDRCSVYLSGTAREVRLVATSEDPALRNMIVDLERYPELQRAFAAGETVLIPDAAADPMLASVQATLAARNIRTILVVPMCWRGTTIGAIVLRTERDGAPFDERDVRFCQVVAALTASALRNAHRFETLSRTQQEAGAARRAAEMQRIALVAFMRRLLSRYAASADHAWAETLLPREAAEELERLATAVVGATEHGARG